MQRAMATEAEATREAKAKVITAEGEQKASLALRDAAFVISKSPIALQLRYLQTLVNRIKNFKLFTFLQIISFFLTKHRLTLLPRRTQRLYSRFRLSC